MKRLVNLEGCLNFRDLGGYPTDDGRAVRWQQVYRSDGLQALTAADVTRLRDQLRIGTVIDLRSTPELRATGRGLLGAYQISFHHLPLYDGKMEALDDPAAVISLTDRYFLLATHAREQIGRVITTVAEAEAPLVYHCAAGKDRTGIVSAILLGLLGVREEIIVADYAASRENLDAIVERLMATKGYRTMLAALPPGTLHAEPTTMVEFLDRLRRRYGSMPGYAHAAGVTDATIERLLERLLDS